MATFIHSDWWLRRCGWRAGYQMRTSNLIDRLDLTEDDKVVLEKAFLCGICYRVKSVQWQGLDCSTCGVCRNPVCAECFADMFDHGNRLRVHFAVALKDKVLIECPYCRKASHTRRFKENGQFIYDTLYGAGWFDEELAARKETAQLYEEMSAQPVVPAVPRDFMDR